MKKLLTFGDGPTIHTSKRIDILNRYFKLYFISFPRVRVVGIKVYYFVVDMISASGRIYQYLLKYEWLIDC